MHDILVRPVLTFHLAFGLEWQPLISGRASKAAKQIARQRKASHLVMDGTSPASFGYGFLRASAGLHRLTLHSAAQNMARLYPTGSVACILHLSSAGYWLVAVHEGAVMSRTDVVCRSREQAETLLEALRRNHPRLVVLSADHDGPSLEAIAKASEPGTSLRNTGRRRRQWVLRLCFLLLAGAALTAMYRAWFPKAVQTARPAIPAAEIESRWRQAIQEAERGITLHGVAATHTALRQLQDVPARLSGWTLARVACQADKALWRCMADFDRRHPRATNDGLLTNIPSGWTLSFPSIERASATWEFHTSTQSASGHHLDTAAHNRRHLQSAWQSMRPAFGRIEIGRPNGIEIKAPLDDEGQPLPPPANMPEYSRSTVQFEGPLRSVSLLLPHTRSIGWRSFNLVLGESTSPTLASSRFRVTLHGDLYELRGDEKV